MKKTRLCDLYSIDSPEYEKILRTRRLKIRRKREMKIKVCMLLLGIVFTLVTTITISYAFPISDVEDTFYKYYTSVVIEAGDSLWAFAEKYGDSVHYESERAYIEEVMQINHMKDENIKAGNHIILPYYSSEYKK